MPASRPAGAAAGRLWSGGAAALAALLVTAALLAQASSHEVYFETDPPMAGLEIVQNGHALGRTSASGNLSVPATRAGEQTFVLRLPDGRTVPVVQEIALDFDNKVTFVIPAPPRPTPAAEAGGWLQQVLPILLAVLLVIVVVVLIIVVRRVLLVPAPAPAAGPPTVVLPAAGSSATFERYVLGPPLGRGGMATVYAAHDSADAPDREIALKLMHDELLNDADLVRKFLREGESLQRIESADPDAPVPRVYRFGRAEDGKGLPFIAMELLRGENALQCLKRMGRLPLLDAAWIVAGVARALIPAHAMGVYHRDLTPDNVILVDEPRGGFALRLIDFGVARHEFTAHGTLDGSITGKPPFMSPEQCRGVPVDGRSDIYALGIMLFTFLTGQPPFVSKNPIDVLRMHQEMTVVFPPTIDEPVQKTLGRALAKDRDARHPTIREFYEEVSRLGGLG